LRHDYNPRESIFYEILQKSRFILCQPGRIALEGGALVIRARVASGVKRWQSGWVAL